MWARGAIRQALRWMLVTGLCGICAPALAQTPAGTVTVQAPANIIVRRIVMKDALAAEQMKQQLDSLKSAGLFRAQLPGDAKKPQFTEISFLASGNYLLVIGDRDWVDSQMGALHLIAFYSGRPRSHLRLNLRVVQITGPANNDVIQMTEAVQALVATQRAEVARAFGDLQAYLLQRLATREKSGAASDLRIYQQVRRIMPTLGDGSRPLTVPEILLLLLIDRALPALPAEASSNGPVRDTESALVRFPSKLSSLMQNPHLSDAELMGQARDDLTDWKAAVGAAADWCHSYADQLGRKDGIGVGGFREALQRLDCPLPSWVALRMQQSLALTERLYPNLVRRQTQESLQELERRFRDALNRAVKIDQALTRAETPPPTDKGKRSAAASAGAVERDVLALQAVAEGLVSVPQKLFDSVAVTADNSGPSIDQLVQMFDDYATFRGEVGNAIQAADQHGDASINFARLQAVEAGLNLWLRRASEAMARALDQQFYSRYVEQLRLLANKRLGKTSSRDILADASIEDVPDVARDILLADTGVNIFVSNSVNLQFAPDKTNSVSAEVQASLPSKLGLPERVEQAKKAGTDLQTLAKDYGIAGGDIVRALLAGGQAVPVQSGINLSAKPSIALDGSTVTLTLTAQQTLQPDTDKVVDRVTRHSIDNATVTVLSYEPMVLSTLTSNISYYENVGGMPVLRRIPGVRDLLNDIGPLKTGRRQKGIYQSSVIILEPVVIPTIEDLARFYSGWREMGSGESAATSRQQAASAGKG